MKLHDLQREAENLSPEEQRKLIGFLVTLNIRRDKNYRQRLSQQLDDQDTQSWIKLDEARRQLKADGV